MKITLRLPGDRGRIFTTLNEECEEMRLPCDDEGGPFDYVRTDLSVEHNGEWYVLFKRKNDECPYLPKGSEALDGHDPNDFAPYQYEDE